MFDREFEKADEAFELLDGEFEKPDEAFELFVREFELPEAGSETGRRKPVAIDSRQ